MWGSAHSCQDFLNPVHQLQEKEPFLQAAQERGRAKASGASSQPVWLWVPLGTAQYCRMSPQGYKVGGISPFNVLVAKSGA